MFDKSINLYFFSLIFGSFVLQILTIRAHAEVIPTQLTRSERKNLAPYFSTAYPQLVTTRPYFIGNYPGLEIGASISYKSLSDLQADFPAELLRNELVLTQLFIKKSLVHRFEITFSSTLSSFGTTQVSGFGGMLSWHPLTLNDSRYLPSMAMFTNYMNFEDSLTYQESGILLSLGQNFKKFSLNTGISLSQMNARFSGLSSGRQITVSGNSETEDIYLQTVFVSLVTNYNNYFITLVQNYNLGSGFEPGVIVSYQF